MHVLQISWEFPPLIYGGLGRHVTALTESLVAQGVSVTVLTQRPAGTAEFEQHGSIAVHRVTPPSESVPMEPNALVEWTTALDAAMAERAAQLCADLRPDVVHAHDWVVHQSAVACARANIPLVATVHATEAGRHQGWVHSEISQQIHRAEFALTRSANRVVTCSTAMRREVHTLFDVPADSVDVIPNGIDLAEWTTTPSAVANARKRFLHDSRPLVLLVGRLEWEKGVHTLLEAAKLLTAEKQANSTLPKFVIAGTGTRESILREEAQPLIDAGIIEFAGRVDDQDLRALIAIADVQVIPSIYEPFGLVALEAAALGTPIITSRTGGLADIAGSGCALTFSPENATELAQAIQQTLAEPADAQNRAAQLAARLPSSYSWTTIAAQTESTYRQAQSNGTNSVAPELGAIPTYNLLR